MDPAWLLLLPVAALSGWFAARRRYPKSDGQSSSQNTPDAYFQSLNFLLNEQHDKALDVLVEALEEHDESLEIQLALGSLFRRRGEIERATQLHQGLIARPGLAGDKKGQVLFELATDYFKAGLLGRAENLLVESGSFQQLREPALRLLVQVYESEKEWESAIGAATRLNVLTGEKLGIVIAQYHCERAERYLSAGDNRSSEKQVSQALALDSGCARALILQGRLEASQGMHREAVESWTRLGEDHPAFLYEVVHLVKGSANALDDELLFWRFLDQAVAASGDERLHLMLIDHLATEKNAGEAEEALLMWVSKTASLVGVHRLLQLREEGPPQALKLTDVRLLQRATQKILADRPGYECRFCGFLGKTLHWQCPGCRHWNSTLPRSASVTLDNKEIL